MASHNPFCAREVGTTIGLTRTGRLRRTLTAASVTTQDLEALYLEEMAVEDQ